MMRILIFMLACCAAAAAQAIPSRMEEAGKENLPAQKLGADDLVGVSVYDAPELTRTVRIEADGAIRLPLLRREVEAAGTLPRELEGRIVEALEQEQILVNPIVKVTVVEYHSRPVSVMGAVRKPTVFQAMGAVTLLEALAHAEGLAEDAGTEILVTRERTVAHIAVSKLIKDADPAANLALHGGEEIRVPPAGKIFVVGNVLKPGAFPVRDGNHSVLRMVALSEGLQPYAAKVAYVYRRDETGARKEIPIELAKILERKAADVPLEVDDVLYIPDNRARRNVSKALDRITSFGASTASGVLIWH